MGAKSVGKCLYSPDTIVRAFKYFATSRTLYYRLREDFQLPSVETLKRITSRISKLDELFTNSVFKTIDENKRLCRAA